MSSSPRSLEENLAEIRRDARNFALSAQLGDQQAVNDLYCALEAAALAIESLAQRVEALEQ